MPVLLKALGGAVVIGVIWFIRGIRPGMDNQKREEAREAAEANAKQANARQANPT